MIEKNYNEVSVKEDVGVQRLINFFIEIDEEINFQGASIYHNFPIYPNLETDTPLAANVIFLSQQYGIFIFQCIATNTIQDEDNNKLSDIDRLIFAKILKESPRLQKDRRTLKIEINSFFFSINEIKDNDFMDFKLIVDKHSLKELFPFVRNVVLSKEEFDDLKATIEGSKGIPLLRKREIKDPKDYTNSKGAILSAIENEIYNFDMEQKRAALFVLDGAQRIRGLAGSGKTVILAMKVAIIHLQFPDAEILYTYYTKSLNDLVKNLITRFYRQFADQDPNWEKIHIMHAWGGVYLEGVYSNACQLNNVPKLNLTEAKRYSRKDPFDYICEELNKHDLIQQYDYAILDEAQDFPVNFYRLCRKITYNNRVIWAYDDFQNILNINIQDEKETFGKDKDGKYYIDFSKQTSELQDLILHRCYRTPMKILVAAFSLGLGIYNKENENYRILQRLENNQHWNSLGFEVEQGNSQDNSEMVIGRPTDNSSQIKNKLLNNDNVIHVRKCNSYIEEAEYIVDCIKHDLEKELRPEDICVICLDHVNVKKYFYQIEGFLDSNGIASFNLLNAPSTNTIYKIKDHVTLSTIFNAKGNEAGCVYIIGIDAVFNDKNNIIERNKIFTAMTRSLAWVTMTGCDESVKYCVQELEELKKNDFKLVFKQPSEEDVKTIRQGISNNQKLLNDYNRMIERMMKETGLSEQEVLQMINASKLKK